MSFHTFRTSDGASLAYKVLGKAGRSTSATRRPIILINGMSAVMEDWAPLDSELSKSRPVIIYDHRGIGHSKTQPDTDLTIERMAKDAVELVHHLGYGEVDVLGFSMGGLIAQQVLLLDSPVLRVPQAVLAATMCKPPHSDFAAISEASPGMIGAGSGAGRLSEEDKRKAVEAMVRLQYHEDGLRESAALRKKAEERVRISVNTRRPAKQIVAQLLAINDTDLRPRLSSIPPSTRVLVIAGSKDRMVWRSEADYILRGIPHAKLAKFSTDDFGHLWYDYGEIGEWGALLGRFLDDEDDEAGTAKAKL